MLSAVYGSQCLCSPSFDCIFPQGHTIRSSTSSSMSSGRSARHAPPLPWPVLGKLPLLPARAPLASLRIWGANDAAPPPFARQELMGKGVGGSGSGLQGAKLSGSAHNPSSLRDGRMRALAAAEKRSQRPVLGQGGKLGGRTPLGCAGLAPAAMAARAASRRQADDGWCQSGQTVELDEEQAPQWLEPPAVGGAGGNGGESTASIACDARDAGRLRDSGAAASGSSGAARGLGRPTMAALQDPNRPKRQKGCGGGGGGGSGGRTRVCIGPNQWVSKSTASTGMPILEPIGHQLPGSLRRYRCSAQCVVRAGCSLSTAEVGVLAVGSEVTAIQEEFLDTGHRSDGKATSNGKATDSTACWDCATCTLSNPSTMIECAACGQRPPRTEQPRAVQMGLSSLRPGAPGIIQGKPLPLPNTDDAATPTKPRLTTGGGISREVGGAAAAASARGFADFWPQCPSCTFLNSPPVMKNPVPNHRQACTSAASAVCCDLCKVPLQRCTVGPQHRVKEVVTID